jgi:hypothetical protein
MLKVLKGVALGFRVQRAEEDRGQQPTPPDGAAWAEGSGS